MVQELPILSFDIWDMVIGLFGLFWWLWTSFVTQTWQPCWLSQNVFLVGVGLGLTVMGQETRLQKLNQNWTYQNKQR